MRPDRHFKGCFRTTAESHPVAARISNRQFRRLENISKPMKTKAHRDFLSTVSLAGQTHEFNHHFHIQISVLRALPHPPFSVFTLPFWWLTAPPSFRQTSPPKDLGAPASRCPANSSRPPLHRRMIHCEEPQHD